MAREQQAWTACHAAMRYIALGRPPSVPDDVFSCGDPGAYWQTPAAPHQRRHRPARPPTDPATSSRFAAPGGTRGLFVERGAYSHLRTAAHAPLGHAGLPIDSFLPPRHNAHIANAQTFLLVDWYEHLHPVVASPLPQVPSTENFAADGTVAVISMPLLEGHGRQRRLLRPPSGHAPRQHLHPDFH